MNSAMSGHMWPESEDHYRAILESNSKDEDARLKLAEILFARLQPASARAVLQQGLERAPESLHLLNKLGQIYLLCNDWDDAEAIYTHIGKTFDTNVHVNPLGIVALNRGLYRRAEALFTEAIKRGGHTSFTFCNLGEALLRQERYRDAFLKCFEGYKQFQYDTNLVVQFWRPSIYLSEQLRDAVRSAFGAAYRQDPADPHVLYHLGILESYTGEWEQAKRYFNQAIEKGALPTDWTIGFFQKCLERRDLAAIRMTKVDESFKAMFWKHSPANSESAQQLYGDLDYFAPDLYCKVVLPISGQLLRNHFCLSDLQSRHLTIADGVRKTPGSPECAKNRVFCGGVSQLRGGMVDNCDTICSYLQKRFNQDAEKSIEVQNCAIMGTSIEGFYLWVRSLPLARGDSVVLFYPGHYPCGTELSACAFLHYLLAMRQVCREKGARFFFFSPPHIFDVNARTEREEAVARYATYYERGMNRIERFARFFGVIKKYLEDSYLLKHLVIRPHHMGEIFDDMDHFNHRLNARIADYMFQVLTRAGGEPTSELATAAVSRDLSSEEAEWADRRSLCWLRRSVKEHYKYNVDLNKWLNETRTERFSGRDRIGGIVVNANPFTLGHRYLIEQALLHVDALYVFVVNEDKSYYSFEDRLRLVKEGTRDLYDRVEVIPSGGFIISSFTFSGYFTKEEAMAPADSTTDVAIFGAVIAPSLNIRTRFVGEEPSCLVTRAYNQTMTRLLPGMGVDVRVIPRRRCDGHVISASSVRELMREGRLKAVRPLVPATTYRYLCERNEKESKVSLHNDA